MQRPGFLLVELMIALAVVGTVVAFTITNLKFLDRIMVRCELDKLHAAALYGQRCAQMKNQEVSLAFDTTQGGYSLRGHRELLARGVAFGFLPGVPGPSGTTRGPIRSPITYAKEQITFFPTGIMQAGTVYLVDNNATMMYALSSPISQFSFMRKYRYDTAWQRI